ncbi:MAG: hypothetical protein FRX49_13090 [Trebouxia sp. A1-2]|nr:MAG: hypothetical protein FRX49_13090 [Trebouxia sp. A1-2]
MNQNKSEVRNRPALLPHELVSQAKYDMEASSSSSQSSLRDLTTLHLDEPQPQGLRGLHQENSLLRDELTTSKSTILHLIHELNQAKNQTRAAAASHNGSRLQVEAASAESHVQTQMSSTTLRLEGSPAPPLSPSAAAATPAHQSRGRMQPFVATQEAREEPAISPRVLAQWPQTGFGPVDSLPGSPLKATQAYQSGKISKRLGMQKGVVGGWVGAEKGVGSTAQQLRLRDSMLADLRSQNKALADEVGQYMHEQRRLQGQIQASKGLKEHNARLTRQLKEARAEWRAAKEESKALQAQLDTSHKQAKHGSNKTALAKEQVRAYEAKLASKTDMMDRLYDCLTALQRQYEINKEDGLYWQQTAQAKATQLAMAETELEQLRHEVAAAQGQAQYLNQQWADIHADLLEERDRHEARRASPARTTSHLRTNPTPAKHRPTTARWHLHHSFHAPSPAVSPLHPHRSFPVSPYLHPHASPAASPLQTHWSPRNIPDAASPCTVQQGQLRKTRMAQATAAARGLHHAQDRQNWSRQRQASMAEPSIEDSAEAQGMPVASSTAIRRTLQQPALQTDAAQGGQTTSRKSAAAPGSTPVRVQRCSVEGASYTAAPAVSPRHAADDGRRSVQTEQPDVHSTGVGSSPVQAQHIRTGTDRSAGLISTEAGQEAVGEPVTSSAPRQVSAKEQELWEQLQAANKDLQRAAQSQSVLQQQMEAASAAASQYKQQAQGTGRLDSFKQQVSQLKVISQAGNLRASQDSILSSPGASTSYDHLSVPQAQLSVNKATAQSHPAKWAVHANEIVG